MMHPHYTEIFQLCHLAFVSFILFNHFRASFEYESQFQSCLHLNPRYGSKPSQSADSSPYQINATAYVDGDTDREFVYVQIFTLNDSVTFRGFGIQARLANNPDYIVDGEFVPAEKDLSRAFMCKINEDMIFNNTWTHTNNQSKTEVNAFWYPSKINDDPIIFFGTIIHNTSTYWTDQQSEKINLSDLASIDENEELNINTTQVYNNETSDEYTTKISTTEFDDNDGNDDDDETINTEQDQNTESSESVSQYASSTSVSDSNIQYTAVFTILSLSIVRIYLE